MSDLKTTIVVSFGTDAADATGILTAELYDAINPDSPFKLTDVVNFLVFKSNNVDYDTPLLSSGALASIGPATIAVVDDIQSVGESESISLSKPNGHVLPSFTWFGNTPTSITLQPDGTFSLKGIGPFIGKASYNATGYGYSITPPLHPPPAPAVEYAVGPPEIPAQDEVLETVEWRIMAFITGRTNDNPFNEPLPEE